MGLRGSEKVVHYNNHNVRLEFFFLAWNWKVSNQKLKSVIGHVSHHKDAEKVKKVRAKDSAHGTRN